ncbi:SPOR domain-containing protein [Rhodobacter sp. Har01]|uniref:SPOR domain-containing protein n=1 Tax=Rhodobacter sp. Har01 TaxID=2883999 RepID=UPI001D06F533|nr:SPOR domain-containing protein [Rhodobacter sp. Har01]MCB6178679.1 SPOR domain-containing protein [Rhodobacter sp. Har01]
MTARSVRRLLLLSAAAWALQACEPGTGPFAARPPADKAAAEATAKPQRSTKLVDRDVEAPEVFQVTDSALWDGRPSLGGVWVASPDTKDPERVIMRNPANGKFVIGALFKREVENPGPKLQISSDAAEALGLLAGQPATLSVTALRREEVADEAPVAPMLDTAETLDAPAAPGAIDAGGVETKPLDAGPEAPAVPAADSKKKVRKSKKATETAAAATAALDAAEGKSAPDAAPAAAPADAPADAPAAAPAAAASGGRPIQIGFFSVEANAKRAVDTLAKSGIAAEMRAESAKGKSYWSVIARGDAALLKKIKAAGFADAYLLK